MTVAIESRAALLWGTAASRTFSRGVRRALGDLQVLSGVCSHVIGVRPAALWDGFSTAAVT